MAELYNIAHDDEFEAFTKAYRKIPKKAQMPFTKTKFASGLRYCAHCGRRETMNRKAPVYLSEQDVLLLDGKSGGKQLLCGACLQRGLALGFVPKSQ